MSSSLRIAYLLSVGLMLLTPIFISRYLAIKYRVPWSYAGWGALLFILVQIFHIPVVALIPSISPLFSSRHLVLYAITLGVLAGLFEEGGRYVSFRYLFTRLRKLKEGVIWGVGWGGVEAFLFGGIALFVTLLLFTVVDLESLLKSTPLPSSKLEEILKQIRFQKEALFQAPLYGPFLPALERTSAMILQVFFSLMVLKAVQKRKWGFLFVAFGVHSGIDSVAVILAPWMQVEDLQTTYLRALSFELALLAIASSFLLFSIRPSLIQEKLECSTEGQNGYSE